VPSLEDWEKEWARNAGKDEILKAETLKSDSERRRRERRTTAPKLLPVDFRSPVVLLLQSN